MWEIQAVNFLNAAVQILWYNVVKALGFLSQIDLRLEFGSRVDYPGDVRSLKFDT